MTRRKAMYRPSGGPSRTEIICGIVRETHSMFCAYRLDVNIDILLLWSGPDERHLVAVGRETRAALIVRIAAQRNRPWHSCRRRQFLPEAKAPDPYSGEQNEDDCSDCPRFAWLCKSAPLSLQRSRCGLRRAGSVQRGYKTITATREGLDETRVVGVIIQRDSNPGDSVLSAWSHRQKCL